jgi:group I intron endonuclease
MKKIIGIYKITSPSGKVYIGQSIDIEKRFNIYRFLSCKSQKKLYASFLRYGVENHTFEIIMECKKNELNYYERHYQEYYNVLDEYGLNLKYTQVAEKKQVYSEETRKKLSQNHVSKKEGYVNHMKGKTHSEETKRKISENKKGKKLSKEHIEKSANARRGKKHTEEHKIKIGMANKGKIRSEKQKENWL